MEECERKKKLKAGKEKLAAFQKKKSRKKKKIKDGDSTILGIDVGEVSDVSSTSEMSSGADTQSNEDSDQQSLSGLSDDETPKEEGNLPALLQLKAKLQSANQRIEELEECIMGKQLALDKVIVENEKLRKEVASERVDKLEDLELKESEYVTQESKHGLSSLESVSGDSCLNGDGEKGDLNDIQDLTQQVQWLQVQLKQAGMALQDQADRRSFSVQALQEAKSEILNLQQNVTQKDQIIYQLAEKLTQVSQQYSLLQRAHDSLRNEDKKDADSTYSIAEVEVKLEGLKLELETEHKKILNEMSNALEGKKEELDGIQNENEELKKMCETSQIELRNQREELEKNIAKLSEELMNAQANNEKLRQHLESVNEENRALLDEWDRTKTEKEEANFKIKFLEQQLKDSLDHMETDKLKLESMEIELLSEREEKLKVNEVLQKYKEEVMILKEEKEHANLKIQHFNEENASLKDEKEKANAERSLLQKQFEDFKESISSEFHSLTSQLNESLEQTSDVKSVNEVLCRELEKLKAERSGMQEQLDMYHSQVDEYEGTISQMHLLQEENQALRIQNDELYNKINNQKDIIVGLKAELDVLSVDNKQLGEQLQVFTSDLSHHQREIDIIETERHAFTEEMENLQRHYMDLQSESEVYKSSTVSLSQHIAELKQELSISTTDNSSQLDTRSSADGYQIAESAQRRMMPLEECTITPSVVTVTHDEIRESYNNTESALLTTWTLDQAQCLDSQNSIIEQQSQRVEEGMIVPDVSTVVTVHLDKTWEDESSLKESPDTPETLPTLLELAANHEDPSKSSLDQITLLADKIQKLYSILAALSVQDLVSCSLATDGNTGTQKDDSDAKIGSFMSGGDSVERKQDKDLMLMAEQSDIERVRFEKLRTGIENLQKCLNSLNYSLEVIFPSSPRCSVTDEVGDPIPCDSPKQMTVTSLDDIGVKVSSSNLQVEMSCQEQLKHASSSLIDCCQGDVDLGLSEFAFVLPTAVDACIQTEDSRRKLYFSNSEMETSQGSKDTISWRGEESRQSIISESKSHFEGEIELEQNVSRQEIESLNIEIGRLQEVLKICLTEKADLLELVETERHRAKTAEEGLQISEEQCQKCSKDLENQITCKQQSQIEFDSMISKLSELETSLSQISIENEVLVSERDKLADQNEELKDLSDNFKSDIIELENKVSEMSEENKTLKSVGDKLLEQGLFLSQSMNDKAEMEATIGELEQTLRTLQHSLESLEQEKEYLKEELERKESIEEKIEDLAGTVSEFQEHRAKLEMENELLRQESQKFQLMALDIARTHEELKEDRRCLVERLEAIVEEKEKLQSHASEKANLLSEFQDELDDLRIQNEGLKTKVEAFEFITNEREKLSQEVNDLKKMCKELNEKISDLLAEKENLIIKYESEMDGLMQESSTLKTKESSLQDEVQELLQELKEKDNLKENLDCTAVVVIHCIKKEVQNLIRQVQRDDSSFVSTDEIKSRVCEQDNVLISATNEDVSLLENALDELKLEVEQLKLEINDAQSRDFVDYKNMPENRGKMFSETNRELRASDNSDKESLLSQLELEKKYKAKMQKDLEKLQKDYEILQRKFVQVQEDLERCHQHLRSVEEERNELEDLTLQLQEDMKMALVDRDNVHQEFETLVKEYNTFDQQKDGFVEEIETLQMHLNAVSENRNHVRTQVEILAAELDNVSKSRDDFAIKYYVMEKENQRLRAENSKNLHYFSIIQDKVSQFEKVLDEKYGLEGENQTLTERIECLNDRVDSLEKEKASLSHLTQRLTNTLTVMQTKYEEIKSDMETTKKNCDREIEKLKHQLKQVNDSVYELKSTLEFFENELCDTNDERICLKENLERQTAEIQEVIEEKQRLQELNEKYQKDLKNKKLLLEQQNQRTSHMGSHDQVSNLTTHEMGVQTEAELVAGTFCMDMPSIFETVSTGFQTDISCIMKKVCSVNLNQTEDRLEINKSERVHPNSLDHPTNISSSLFYDGGVHVLLERGISHEITSEDPMDPHFDLNFTHHELSICDNGDDIKEGENKSLVCRSLAENDQEGNVTELGNIKGNVGVETNKAVTQRKILQSYEMNRDCDYSCVLDSLSINDWHEKSSQTENCEPFVSAAQTDHNLIAIFSDGNILSEDKETFTHLTSENRSVQTSSRLLSCSFEVLANVDIDGLESTNASQSAVQDSCVQTDKIPSNCSIVWLDSIDNIFEGSELEKQPKFNNLSTQTEDSSFTSAFEESCSVAFSSKSLISDSDIVPSVDSKERIEKTSCDDLQGPNVLIASEEVTKADKILVHHTEVKELCQKEKQKVNNQDEQVEVMAQENFELELSKIRERYELQMKQKEYEFEEKFAMEIRSKQVELMHQMDLEKKEIMKNMELVMKRKVEKVKKEKEKVFVETMRKVRADLKEKHERKLEELHQKMMPRIPRRSEMVGSPRQTDDDDTIQRLQKENQQLAKARDALMQQLDLSEQQQKQLQDDLQNLLADEEWLELDDDDGMQIEMGNEFGFGDGSVLDWKIPSSLVHRLSQDLTSATGGQDNGVSHACKSLDNTQCSRPECKALQEKYINIRRKLENLGGSLLLGASSERPDVFSEEEQMCIVQDISISAKRPDDKDTDDKFICDEDQDAQVLQRLTSIHLEHSVRTPIPASAPLDNENKFIFDDEGSVSVSHSKDEKCIGNGRSEGHFSEQNSEDEKVEDGHSGGKEGYFSEQESDEEDLMPAHLSHENSPLHTSSGSSSQNVRWTPGTGFSMVNDGISQFYEISKYKEYHERTPISDDETEVSLSSSSEKKTTSSGKSDLHSEKYGKEGAFVPNVDQVLEIHPTHELKLPRRTKSESSDDTKDTSANQSHGSISSYNQIPRSLSLSFVAYEKEQHLALLTDEQNRFVSELSPQIENLPLQEELESDSVYLEESDIIQSDSGFVQEFSDMTFRSESDSVKESSDESTSFVKDFDIGKSVQNNMVEPEKDKSQSKCIRQSDSNNSKEDGTLPRGPITLKKHSDMLSGKDPFEVEGVDVGGVLESAIGQVASISSASADMLEPSGGDDVIHRETDDYKSLRKLCEELKLQIDILKEEKDSLEIKALLNEELDSKLRMLEEEKQYLQKKVEEQLDHFGKEKQEFMSRSSLLVAEIESLALSKDQLEDKLRKQQEEFEQYIIKLEETRSEESLRESNQEIQELKLKVLDLEKDIREKDAYVRKLEEHFLNQEKGLPSKGSTVSLASPGMGKTICSEREALETRRHSLNFSFGKVEQNKRDTVREPSEIFCPMDQSESLSLDGDFVDAMYETEYRHFQNSSHVHQAPTDSHFIEGDGDSSLPLPDELDYSGLSLDQSIDGHVAMEQKHFELLEEISHLKRDFRETKAIYSKEIILLQTTLEKERCLQEGLQSKTEHRDMNCQDILSSDVVHLRQKIAVLNETNKLLRIENDRWMLRIKEQEAVVMELREKMWYQKGGIDEVEEVFGKQLALLQKQREDLIEQLRKREHDDGKLSQILGEKAVLEDTLKKEKAIIVKKLQEKAAVETQLHEMELEVVRQKQELKRLEELMYQKDLTERELMRQKRLLEEELRDIEAKFRDREEHLGIEKNKLLDELRHERLGVRSRNQHSEGDIDNVSVASDCSSISTRSVVSEIEFGRLELMLEEVGRQHSNAVEVLRDKLSSRYKRKERAILQKHVSVLQSNDKRSSESDC